MPIMAGYIVLHAKPVVLVSESEKEWQ